MIGQEDVVLIVCAGVCALGLLGMWLLRNPDTRASRWLSDEIDDATTLPPPAPPLRVVP